MIRGLDYMYTAGTKKKYMNLLTTHEPIKREERNIEEAYKSKAGSIENSALNREATKKGNVHLTVLNSHCFCC